MTDRTDIGPWQLALSFLFHPSATARAIMNAVNHRYEKDGIRLNRDEYVETLLAHIGHLEEQVSKYKREWRDATASEAYMRRQFMADQKEISRLTKSLKAMAEDEAKQRELVAKLQEKLKDQPS